MTANQRRPGFRLPWSTEDNESSAVPASDTPVTQEPPTAKAATESATPATQEPPTAKAATEPATPADAPAAAASPASPASPEADVPAADALPEPSKPVDSSPAPAPATAASADADVSPDFMRDLVSAMRRVAEEARQTSITELQAIADEQVKRLEADAEGRRAELRARADADVAGIGEWAKAEAERIRNEAEQREVARRDQLEQQLNAETARAEAETKALRDRIEEYERELEAYHAQLAEIKDPAAFAAAAKRMPRPPSLTPPSAPRPAATGSAAGPAAPSATVASPAIDEPTATNGVTPAAPEVHPAEEEVLATRLAELDAELEEAPSEAPAPASSGEPTTTDIVVSGLGSFGAITGFRQSLASVAGVEGVALSLGQTGEFIFRATHRTGFDMASAITTLESDAATVESRPDGSLHVTLDRGR